VLIVWYRSTINTAQHPGVVSPPQPGIVITRDDQNVRTKHGKVNGYEALNLLEKEHSDHESDIDSASDSGSDSGRLRVVVIFYDGEWK
jgi:hypothetical protein